MPTQVDLCGVGVSGPLADKLGNQPTALTATGTAQGTAATMLSTLVTVTAGAGADGIILPANAMVGTPYYVFNSSGTTAKVYCPSGHTMNTSSNGSVSVVTHVGAVVFQTSKGVWASIKTA